MSGYLLLAWLLLRCALSDTSAHLLPCLVSPFSPFLSLPLSVCSEAGICLVPLLIGTSRAPLAAVSPLNGYSSFKCHWMPLQPITELSAKAVIRKQVTRKDMRNRQFVRMCAAFWQNPHALFDVLVPHLRQWQFQTHASLSQEGLTNGMAEQRRHLLQVCVCVCVLKPVSDLFYSFLVSTYARYLLAWNSL